MWVLGVIAAGFVAAVWWIVRWSARWKDVSGDTTEGQAKARLWSTKNYSSR